MRRDRKSTRLNSSHVAISYAVFCLKKKKTNSWSHSWHKTRKLRRIPVFRDRKHMKTQIEDRLILAMKFLSIIHVLPFFFNDPATTVIYTLSLHDALPI